jgi:hypothetical protein
VGVPGDDMVDGSRRGTEVIINISRDEIAAQPSLLAIAQPAKKSQAAEKGQPATQGRPATQATGEA